MTGRGANHSSIDDAVAALVAATAQARAEFGVACFWNAPRLADPVEDARMVVGRLRHYGGRRGWAAALRLVEAIRLAANHATRPDRPERG